MTRIRKNIPNALTLLRLILALLFVFFPHGYRLTVVIVAGVTDVLDGILARKLDAKSEFGRIMDPVADRAFAVAMALTFILEARLTFLQLLLVGMRDIVVVLGALAIVIAGRRGEFRRIRTRIPGKVASVAQFAFLVTIILAGHALWSLVVVTAAVSSIAAVDYIRFYFREVRPRTTGVDSASPA